MKKGLLLLLLAITLLFFIRFVVGGSEDDWICVDGAWVQHGHPSAPMPMEKCGD